MPYRGRSIRRERPASPALAGVKGGRPLPRVVSCTSSPNQLLRRVFLITAFIAQRTGILIL